MSEKQAQSMKSMGEAPVVGPDQTADPMVAIVYTQTAGYNVGEVRKCRQSVAAKEVQRGVAELHVVNAATVVGSGAGKAFDAAIRGITAEMKAADLFKSQAETYEHVREESEKLIASAFEALDAQLAEGEAAVKMLEATHKAGENADAARLSELPNNVEAANDGVKVAKKALTDANKAAKAAKDDAEKEATAKVVAQAEEAVKNAEAAVEIAKTADKEQGDAIKNEVKANVEKRASEMELAVKSIEEVEATVAAQRERLEKALAESEKQKEGFYGDEDDGEEEPADDGKSESE